MLVLAMEFSRSAPTTRASRARGGRRKRTAPPPTTEGERGRGAPSQRNRGGPTFNVAGIQARSEDLRTCPLSSSVGGRIASGQQRVPAGIAGRVTP